MNPVKEMSLSEAKSKFSEVVDEVRRSGTPVVIQRRRNSVAVIIEMDTFRRLQDLEDRVTSVQLRKALKGKTTPLRDVLRELEGGV